MAGGCCSPGTSFTVFQQDVFSLLFCCAVSNQLFIDLKGVERHRHGEQVRLFDCNVGLVFVQVGCQGEYALFQQVVGRNRCYIGVVCSREVTEGMDTDSDTLCLCLVYHLLYAFIPAFGEFGVPVEMSPVQERATMVNVFETGNLSLVQDHIKIVFREIRDQIRFHGCAGCFPPFAVEHRVGKSLLDFNLADTG